MIVIFAFLVGALFGWFQARRLRGNTADRVQYAIAFGIAFAILGLIVTVVSSRYL